MKLSDTTDLTGIFEDIDFICQTDSTSYPLKDKARNVNRHYYKAYIDWMKSEGRTEADDSANLQSIPEYTFTLVAGQSQYALPTNFLKMWGVEVLDADGASHRLKEIDINDPLMASTIKDFESTDGMPKYYDIRGANIFLYPAPAAASTTLTSGGYMLYAREVYEFDHGDTTPEPGIPEPFHRILSIGGSVDWLMVNDTAKVDRWRGEYEQLRAEFREFCSTRNKEVKARLTPIHNQNDFI